MELKPTQKEFIIERFFKNDAFAGWKEIAEKLLDKGKCIVAGDECIWRGGIGNFISTKPANDAYKCSEYTFKLGYFLDSSFYKENAVFYKKKIEEEFLKNKEKYEEVLSW